VTHSPAFDDNHKQAPATSSPFPIRCMGSEPAISFSKASRVAAIILLLKGPSARVLTVIAGPSCEARCRDNLRLAGNLSTWGSLLVKCSFRSGVGISLESRDRDTVDGSDLMLDSGMWGMAYVDDSSDSVSLTTLLQHWNQLLGQGEDSLNIQCQEFSPCVIRVFLE
jgi:hypothetical protein